MKYTELGNTGMKVSRIGFGVLTVGRTQLNQSIEEGAELIRYALSRGMNFLDTAQYYETYPYIREALKDGRYDPVIASKTLDYSARDMRFAIEEARRELNRDVIDIFMLHEVRVHGDFELRAGAWEELQKAKLEGKVRAIGVSTHHIDVCEQMLQVPECDLIFPLINKFGLGIRRGDDPGTAEDMADVIRRLSADGRGIFSMKAFGGGNLTSRYMECLDYVSALPGIDSIMMGFGKKEEVDNACDYVDGKLPPDFQPDISDKKIQIDQGDCEGCGACQKRCPNHAIYMNEKGLANVNHDICLTCGYCAPVCPVRAIIMF
ncbi:MAG: aldo/keto reductase [Anaerovoracaceae bacterium]|jgi:predicted aldo/keto reductase-like oxidoreductase